MKHTLAFPSWVIPGGISENTAFLQQKCSAMLWPPKLRKKIEIGLCFFETKACLAYTEKDLPPALGLLPVSWHVHLPLDLPFYASGAGPKEARQSLNICLELMRKTAFLKTKKAVLHPTCDLKSPSESLTAYFIKLWVKSGREASDLLLENQPGQNLLHLQALAAQSGCGLCLDLAHLFMGVKQGLKHAPERQKEQKRDTKPETDCAASACPSGEPEPLQSEKALPLQQLIPRGYLEQVQMLHLNAPQHPADLTQKQSGHAALSALSSLLQESYAQLLQSLLGPRVLMLELFNWEKIEQSFPLLVQWLSNEI